MSGTAFDKAKTFSVEDANRTLPLVRAIVSDLVELSREVTDRRARLDDLRSRTTNEGSSSEIYRAELADVQHDLQRDARRVREYLEELRNLGIEARGVDGEVDFPSVLDGRPVMLCWKLGESEVLYWHEVNADSKQRQPLVMGGSVNG